MPRLGAHQSIAGGFPRAVDRAVALGCEALQIFTKSASAWRARPLSDAEVEAFRRRRRAARLVVVVAHASYLINVAAADASVRRRARHGLADELDRAAALELDALVLHPGASGERGEAEALRRAADTLGDVLGRRRDQRPLLVLEHTAGQGTAVGYRFEHLASLLDALREYRERLGVCLDTCHLVAAGYELATPEGYRRTLDAFEATIGLSRLKVVHLNDSKGALGSRRDRHEHIGRGHVGRAGFWRLLHDPRLAHLPMVIETPKGTPWHARAAADPMDRRNLRVLRRLLAAPTAPR
jgi:deoxyribonuclease-4